MALMDGDDDDVDKDDGGGHADDDDDDDDDDDGHEFHPDTSSRSMPVYFGGQRQYNCNVHPNT
eukprot:1826769-Karenia_brevis.AAC.1